MGGCISGLSIPLVLTNCFDYHSTRVSFKIRKYGSSNFGLFFPKIVLASQDLLRIHMNLRIDFFYFCKNIIEILIRMPYRLL